MIFDVLVLKESENGYLARPILWPDSVAKGATQQEALDRVRLLIRDLLSRSQLMQVEVDIPEQDEENPWLTKAGMFADDPSWDDFVKTLADYRRELDREHVSEFA